MAADGDGPNSPYTTGLLKALEEPGLKAEEVFKQTRLHVADATKGAQTPWESSSLTGDLILNLSITINPPAQAASPAPAPLANRDAVEAAFWNSIAASTDPQDFEDYLKRFPDGAFSGLAQRRLGDAKRKQQAVAEAEKQRLAAAEAERQRRNAEAEKQRLVALEAERLKQEKQEEDARRQQQAALPQAPIPATPSIVETEVYRREIYENLMKKILDSKVTRWDGPEDYVGKKNPYRSIQKQKALATCIAWTDRASDVRHTGFYISSDKDFASLPKLRVRAFDFCRPTESTGCKCQVIDENDKNVLQVPDDFYKRVTAQHQTTSSAQGTTVASAAPAATQQAALPPSSSTATPPSTPLTREEVSKQVYDKIMIPLMTQKFSQFSGIDSGKPINYRGEKPDKVVVSCIDWKGSTITSVTSRGSSLDWVERWQQGASLGKLRRVAMDSCTTQRESKGCKCQIVDENDKNVLQVPDDFYQRLTAK